jgi:hypothetical protein
MGTPPASSEQPTAPRIGPIFGALILVLLIASLDQTIVSTRFRASPATWAEPRSWRGS